MKPPLPAIEFEYEWVAGTLPPPHHYRFAIRGATDPGARGEVVFVPGYAFESPPRWVSTFDIAPAAAAALVRVLDEQAAWTRRWQVPEDGLSRAVGGSQRTLQLRRAGHATSVPAELAPDDRAAFDAIESAVRATVPEALWRDLRARHAAHIASAPR